MSTEDQIDKFAHSEEWNRRAEAGMAEVMDEALQIAEKTLALWKTLDVDLAEVGSAVTLILDAHIIREFVADEAHECACATTAHLLRKFVRDGFNQN